MLTGKLLGSGFARSTVGGKAAPIVPYRLLIPDKGTANLQTLGAESARWKATAQRFRGLSQRGQLEQQVANRAQFTDEVLATVADNVRLGACCVLVAETGDGKIVGAMSYALIPPREGAINLLAIDPGELVGAPGSRGLRGIGTAMVAAVSRQFLAQGVETVYLHPFDSAAADFWGGRGFGVCGRGMLMCVRGKEGIGRLIDGCEALPDCETCLVCGLARDVEAMRLPSAR